MDVPAAPHWRKLYFKTTIWRDFADHLGVRYCESGPAGCRNHYDMSVHEAGKIDNLGVYHWTGFGGRFHRAKLFKFLFQCAYAQNRSIRQEPEWLATYHAAKWAQSTAEREFKTRLAMSYSSPYRRRVHDLGIRQKVGLRWVYPEIYDWARQIAKRNGNRAKM